LRNVTPEAAMRAVLAGLELSPYRIVDGQIHIGECCQGLPHIQSRVYDVGFVLDAADTFVKRCKARDRPPTPTANSRNSGQGGGLSANGSTAFAGGFGGGGFGGSRAPLASTREEMLRVAIVDTAAQADPDGGASACVVGRRLVVTCSPESHERVRQALDDLATSIHDKENRP
ncbi:MAG: hypothetical protein ACHRHE_20665, partial [Tepidisphaerales bacterium]